VGGKVGDGAEPKVPAAGVLFEATQRRQQQAELKLLGFALSGTVHVDFDVAVTDETGALRHTVVRVEFPDEVRSMLEASSWSRGITICEALERLGGAFLERTGIGALVGEFADGSALRRPTTIHLPLSYLRSTLAAVCAAAT